MVRNDFSTNFFISKSILIIFAECQFWDFLAKPLAPPGHLLIRFSLFAIFCWCATFSDKFESMLIWSQFIATELIQKSSNHDNYFDYHMLPPLKIFLPKHTILTIKPFLHCLIGLFKTGLKRVTSVFGFDFMAKNTGFGWPKPNQSWTTH